VQLVNHKQAPRLGLCNQVRRAWENMAKELRPNWPTTLENVLPKQGGLAKGGLFCMQNAFFFLL